MSKRAVTLRTGILRVQLEGAGEVGNRGIVIFFLDLKFSPDRVRVRVVRLHLDHLAVIGERLGGLAGQPVSLGAVPVILRVGRLSFYRLGKFLDGFVVL